MWNFSRYSCTFVGRMVHIRNCEQDGFRSFAFFHGQCVTQVVAIASIKDYVLIGIYLYIKCTRSAQLKLQKKLFNDFMLMILHVIRQFVTLYFTNFDDMLDATFFDFILQPEFERYTRISKRMRSKRTQKHRMISSNAHCFWIFKTNPTYVCFYYLRTFFHEKFNSKFVYSTLQCPHRTIHTKNRRTFNLLLHWFNMCVRMRIISLP